MPRADATRNRDKILAAARTAFADPEGDVSMAEVSRRAGVGMATLYRNFANRRALLEALYTDEVEALIAATGPDDTLDAWLRRFFAYFTGKRHIAAELLSETGADDPMFNRNRERILASGRPLFDAARAAGEVRDDVTFAQALDLVVAVARVGDAGLLDVALDGLRTGRPAGSRRPRR